MRVEEMKDEVLNLLREHGSMTLPDLYEATKGNPAAVRRAVNSLHFNKHVHISGWKAAAGRGVSAYYKLITAGPGEDAPTPPKSPRTQRRRQKAPSESPRWGALTRHLETIWKGDCHAN